MSAVSSTNGIMSDQNTAMLAQPLHFTDTLSDYLILFSV